ncbi:ABC transporter substrate-binding protein [Paenibacillus sp. JCM 10914]|uniref:ABC transporter substrate-binding protein n=1 Tax=Paenibacillus sp. JCM 10914 TaxID=1236974 RepID=UPI0003CC78E6|nr:ABC transporter substrate-binding protein [Paenibacillus sp. JCM 10914]GAE08448.1 oligopeptide ABC transporter, periplasmic oligopeptide-binding protein OppA [Paenibacillus sp. JCM 10914]
MRKQRYSGLLWLGLLALFIVLSACSTDSANTGSESSPSSPSKSSNSNELAPEPATEAHLLQEPLAATDVNKLPDRAKQRNDAIIVTLVNPSGAFTPYFTQVGYDGNVNSVLYTPLVRVDTEGLPIPGLAEKWDISEDKLTYTYYLREGLKYSDGSPMTTEDVAFTWTLLHDPNYDGLNSVVEANIKGGQAYKEGTADAIEGIQIIDERTISVTLEETNATALTVLGGPILSKAYYGKDYTFGNLDYIKNLHATPITNGPYKLEKFIPGQEVRFIANEHYVLGKPKTEYFIYKTTEGDAWQFIETGEVDYGSFAATTDNIEKLKSLGFVDLIPSTASNYGYNQFNLEREQLKDKRVRQALTYGLNRQLIYVDSRQGAASIANIPSSPILWSYTEEDINPYLYDPEKAKQLLDEAGWTVGADGIREKDGVKLRINYLGSKSPNTDIFIAVAKENYQEIGIDFVPEQFPDFNTLVSKVNSGDYDLASFSTTIISDPSQGVERFIKGETKGYDNPRIEELYAQGLATSDVEERKAIYHEMFKILNDELPIMFTNYTKSVIAINGRIDGFELNPLAGIAYSLPAWNLE